MGAAPKPTLSRTHAPAPDARCGHQSKNDTCPPRTVNLIGDRRLSVAFNAATDARIRAIAERQSGRVARGQLFASGVDPSAIARRLRAGRLERVHRAVYGLPNTSDLPLAPETAALLACGEQAALSHHSAATLWRLRPGVARPVHVTIAGERGWPKLSGVRIHRSLTITPADIRIREHLPVTSPARTLLDVAATLTDRDVESLVDEGLFARRILTMAEVGDVLARAGNHPGRARLQRIAGNHARSTKTDSPPEERLLRLIRAAALPEPELRVQVLDYRLDFYWRSLGLAVEVDAYGTHGSRSRFEADRRRDARLLTEKGIIVLRLTKAAIEQRPFEVVGVLARAIGQREAALRG
jgi:very-short-patch-repair endonuclease